MSNYNRIRSKNIPIFVGNHVVGVVTPDGIFKKTAKDANFLQRPPALALSIGSLEQAEREGAHKVEITHARTGKVYSASIDLIWQHGTKTQRGGYEPQIYLPLEFWEIYSPGESFAQQVGFWG